MMRLEDDYFAWFSTVLVCEEEEEEKRILCQPPYFSPIFQVRVSLSLLVEEHCLSLVFIEHSWVTASVKVSPTYKWCLLVKVKINADGEEEIQKSELLTSASHDNEFKINFLFQLASEVNWILVFLKIFVQEEVIWATTCDLACRAVWFPQAIMYFLTIISNIWLWSITASFKCFIENDSTTVDACGRCRHMSTICGPAVRY